MSSRFRDRGKPSSFPSNVRQAGRSQVVIIYSIIQGIFVCEWKEQLPLGGRRRTTQKRQPALRRDGEGGGTRERALPKHDCRELRAWVAASARLQPDSACVALEEEKRQTAEREARRSQIGSGDRSEKIRTYNFPQDRLTDHRIGLTRHNLPGVLDGDLIDVIGSLRAHFQAEALKSTTNN